MDKLKRGRRLQECDMCGEPVHEAADMAQALSKVPTLVAAQLDGEAQNIWLEAHNTAALLGSGRWEAEAAGWRAVEAAGFAPEGMPKYVKVQEAQRQQPLPSQSTSVLREAEGSQDGNVWEVVLIQAGMSGNRFNYPAPVLAGSVHLFEGARAYADHPTKTELRDRGGVRSARDLVGWYSQPRFIEATKQAVANLHLLESASWLKGLFREIVNNPAAPPLVGISIDALGKSRPARDDRGNFQEVLSIDKVHSADIVTAPAAGGSIVRLVAAEEVSMEPELEKALQEMSEEDLRRLRPDLFKEAPAAAAQAGDPDPQPQPNGGDGGNGGGQGEGEGDPGGNGNGGEGEGEGGTPAPEPEASREPVLAGMQESLRTEVAETRKLREELQRERAEATFQRKLTEANLPGPYATLAQTSFQESGQRRVLTDAEMDLILKNTRDHWAAVEQYHGSGQVRVTPVQLREGQGGPGYSGHDRMVAAIDGMIANEDITLGGQDGERVPRFRSLTEAICAWTGKSPFDLDGITKMRECLTSYDARADSKRIMEALTSASWGEVWADRMHKRMLALYRLQGLDDWRKIVSNIEAPTDFRTNRRIRIGGYGLLETVGEGDTYPYLTSPTDEEATYAVAKRGGLEEITFETIKNDDLAQIRRVPLMLARAAAQTLYRFVFDFLDNGFSAGASAIYDSNALYDNSNHANVAGGASPVVLGDAGLRDAWQRMRAQTAYNNTTEILGTRPRYVVVPNELEISAWQLLNSAVTILTANFNATEPNFFNNKMEVIVVDYWTDANNWHLVADPASIPTIEVGFLDGQEDPELFVQDQPNVGSVMFADKITHKIRHIYSGTVLEYRGFVGSNPS